MPVSIDPAKRHDPQRQIPRPVADGQTLAANIGGKKPLLFQQPAQTMHRRLRQPRGCHDIGDGHRPIRIDHDLDDFEDVDAYRAPFATGARALDGANRARARGRGARTADDGLARTVKEALSASVLTESFPKTQVDACVTVLDARGGEAVACVLAASAALARAGVACRDLVSACECARAGERMMLDPTREEIETSDGMVFLAQMSSMEAYAKTETFGRWNADETERALDACAAGCNRFDAVLREALRANPRD